LIAHSTETLAKQRISFANHPTVQKAMAGEDSTMEFALGNQNYLESTTQIPSSKWVVWVGLNMDHVNAPIQKMRNIMIFFMFVAAVLASIIALFNVRRLMLPLTNLGLTTDQIADGHYDFQLHPSGFSEIDTLASQIDSMSRAIKVREESIIANEKRFRDLVNSIDGIVWEMDYPSFRTLFVSRQAEHLLGYTIQDWYEDSNFWWHKIHPDDAEKIMAYSRLMSEKLEDHSFECRMIAEDGHIVWIRNLVTVVVEDNRPTKMLGVMIDVTAQKKLLEELRHSEENYREIFNGTSDAIFIHDAGNGKIVDVNQAMLNMYGCSYDEALTGDLGKFSKGVSPYTGDVAKMKLQEAVAQGSSSFEWMARKVSGQLFWADVQLRSAMIGQQHRVLASVRDISARKRAVQQLSEALERLNLLINRMPIGCILWSSHFTVNIWNPAAERIFGFTADEMMGNGPFGSILPEDVRPVVEPLWQRITSGDKSAHSVNENTTKQGKTITCEWYNTPVLDASGDIVGAISMVQDISERKAAENELEKYRLTLEDLVRDRSAQLQAAQAELVQKERLAVLGQLTATVSHEIRNPLGTISNSLFLIREKLQGAENEHLDKPLTLAERNVMRCDTIISDLLDFSRQRRIEKTAIKIDGWLTELLEEMGLPEYVQIQRDLCVDSVVQIDPERLRRAIVNVINNALQALDEADKTDKKLMVRSRLVEEVCEIVVQDNGTGMTKDVISRIFEPMFSTKNFGVGLGVPIIKNILEGHCGEVEYFSKAGEGTTVIMRLPLTEDTCEQGD
ncbi:MAG TPA: PAS domain S-box protein, partial [Geopsychrobacteraceae bacterium]|nr:PAS domain S-box protein [Geopsychrobacteraceae bacterium]